MRTREERNAYMREWYTKNKERLRAKTTTVEYREKRNARDRNRPKELKNKQKEYLKQYYLKHRQEIIARSRKWEENNRERKNELCRVWRAANPKKRMETTRMYRIIHAEKVKAARKNWYDKNIKRWAAYAGVRRSRLLQRTPAWADLNAIAEIYENCPVGEHVDHIYPLCGKLVSGLHTVPNLQYLSATENLRKSNKMPDEISA